MTSAANPPRASDAAPAVSLIDTDTRTTDLIRTLISQAITTSCHIDCRAQQIANADTTRPPLEAIREGRRAALAEITDPTRTPAALYAAAVALDYLTSDDRDQVEAQYLAEDALDSGDPPLCTDLTDLAERYGVDVDAAWSAGLITTAEG